MPFDRPLDPDTPRPAPRRRRTADLFRPIESVELPTMGRPSPEADVSPIGDKSPVDRGRQRGLFSR